MAININKVILQGRLGLDPEIRRMNDGKPVATLRIATSDFWRDKQSGERRENTQWHDVVIFNEHLCSYVEKYGKKGREIYVEGQLQTRKWQDQEGKDRYRTEVVLQRYSGAVQLGPAPGGDKSEDQEQGGTDDYDRRYDDEIPLLKGETYMAEVIFGSALQLEAVAARRNEAHIVRDDVEMAQFLAMYGTTALVHGASEEHVRNRFPILKGKGLAIVPASQLLAM